MNREFITSSAVLEAHTILPIRQIYVWFVTEDNQIVIVGNGNGKFQFPGGKPESEESITETINREMFEETGIKMDEFAEQPTLFGYYLVEEDPNWPDYPKYLQLRYYLFTSKHSSEVSLSVNERVDDKDQMQEVKFVDLHKLPEFIPWTVEIPEYKYILGLS
jgi:8-oxo-dGTP pyrophosphatase MutT (NUDIX family)